MIELVLAGMSALSFLSTVGFRIRNRRLKKERERLKEEVTEAHNAVADIISEHINGNHIAAYLKAVGQAAHVWDFIVSVEMLWGYKPNTQADDLITNKCRHCGMIHRYWERGLGTVNQPEMVGYWLDEEKLSINDFRRNECQAVAAKRDTPLLLADPKAKKALAGKL